MSLCESENIKLKELKKIINKENINVPLINVSDKMFRRISSYISPYIGKNNLNNYTLFYLLCTGKLLDLEILKLMISANWNFKDDLDHTTPFHCLCYYNGLITLEMLKFAMNNGANWNVMDKCNWDTPFHKLCLNDQMSLDIKTLKYIIQHGADLHHVNKYNHTPCHYIYRNKLSFKYDFCTINGISCCRFKLYENMLKFIIINGANLCNENSNIKPLSHIYKLEEPSKSLCEFLPKYVYNILMLLRYTLAGPIILDDIITSMCNV
jgi:hypothetical protein